MRILILLLNLLSLSGIGFSQTSFESRNTFTNGFSNDIQTLANGEIIVCINERNIVDGEVKPILARLDACHNQIWRMDFPSLSIRYVLDMVLIDDETIFLALMNFDEQLICMTISIEGEVLGSETIHSIDERITFFDLSLNGRSIMFHGLLRNDQSGLIDNEEKVVVFKYDLVGNNHWSHIYSNYDGDQSFCILDNGDIFLMNGKQMQLLDPEGNIKWQQTRIFNDIFPSGTRPIVVDDGIICEFENFSGSTAFLAKFNSQGVLLWQSEKMSAYRIGRSLRDINGSSFMYLSASRSEQWPQLMTLDSDSGLILESGVFRIDVIDNWSFTGEFAISENGIVNVIYNTSNNEDVFDRTVVLLSDPLQSVCYEQEEVSRIFPNDNELVYTKDPNPGAPEILELIFNEVNIQSEYSDEVLFDLVCPELNFVEIDVDTTITCLPIEVTFDEYQDRQFNWSDGHPSLDRSLDQEGSYDLEIMDCGTRRHWYYSVSSDSCDCNIYVPNIMSMALQQRENRIVLYDCDFDFFELRLFDRWGSIVFNSDDPDKEWNDVGYEEGVYVYDLRFKQQGSDTLNSRSGSVTILGR